MAGIAIESEIELADIFFDLFNFSGKFCIWLMRYTTEEAEVQQSKFRVESYQFELGKSSSELEVNDAYTWLDRQKDEI